MIHDEDEIRRAMLAMERPEARAERERIERAAAAAFRKALEPRKPPPARRADAQDRMPSVPSPDGKRLDLSHTRTCSSLVHLRGYYGDDGENESVLAVSARLDDSPMFPDIGRIIVGSPTQSPLLDGYLAKLGGFCCSPDNADRLADELRAAATAARAEMAKGRHP